MGWNRRRIFSTTVSLLTAVWVFACEDNPEECFSDGDCPSGHYCEPTYYLDGARSGGYCKPLPDAGLDAAVDGGEPDGGAEEDAGGEPEPSMDAAADAQPPDGEDAGDDEGP